MLSGKNNPLHKQPPKVDALMLPMALASCEIVPSIAIGESDKQLQTEYDTLSTTSTVYYSSEEEYPREGEADDEEDTTPTEQNIDEALNCTSPSALSSMVSEWFDTWPVSDEELEKLMGHKESDVGRLEPGRLEPFTWIHVYAYFNKKKRYGGYGVIVRNELGEPIIGSAQFSEDGCCFYYQVFKGINAGVTLAEKGGRTHLRIRCNSIELPYIYCYTHFCADSKCKDPANANNICKFCDTHIKMEMGCGRTKHLVLKLRQKNLIDFQCDWGIAVHYLAKLAKKNRLEAQNKEGMPPMKMGQVRLEM